MHSELTHRYCLLCTTFYEIDETKVHKCYFTNEDLCEYRMCPIDERGTAIFYCSLCGITTKINQDVKCKAAAFSIITQDQIPCPYFCSKPDCPLHPGIQTVYCPTHPDFSNALIIEYDVHEYDSNNAENTETCIYCGTSPELAAPCCHEHMTVENLENYLNKFPLVTRTRVKKSPKFLMDIGSLNRNVSCLLYDFSNR